MPRPSSRLIALVGAVLFAGLLAPGCRRRPVPERVRSTGPALAIPDDITETPRKRVRRSPPKAQAGELKVQLARPIGEAREWTEVAVAFDHPMVALSDDGQPPPVKELPLRFEPAAPFEGAEARWMNANTLIVRPNKNLPLATDYTATVPAGTVSADGAALKSDYVFKFSTRPPHVVRWVPWSYSRWQRLGTSIKVQFDQKIDPARLARHVTLTSVPAQQALWPKPVKPGEKPAGPPPRSLKFRVQLVDAAKREYAIVPLAPLPLDSRIETTLSADLVGQEGPRPMGRVARHQLFTYGPLRASVSCTTGCSPDHTLRITFSNRVRRSVLDGAVKITPEARRFSHGRPDTLTRDVTFEGLKPETTYTVQVRPGITDEFGNRLQGPTRFVVRVGSYEPESTLQAGGVVEAEGPRTLSLRLQNVPKVQVRQLRVPEDRAFEIVQRFGTAKGHEEVLAKLPGVVAYELEVPRDPSQKARLDVSLDKGLGEGGRGLVALELAALGELYRRKPHAGSQLWRRRLVRVTDLGITLKQSAYETLVWVSSLSTGKPVAGAQVRLYDWESKRKLWSGQTDAQGLALGPGLKQLKAKPTAVYAFAALRAADGSVRDLSYVKGDDQSGIRPGDFGLSLDEEELGDWDEDGRRALDRAVEEADRALGFAFVDRGLYRPGDTVKLKGILRRMRKAHLEVPKDAQVDVLVKGPTDEPILGRILKLSEFGTFDLDIRLPTSAKLGGYRATVELLSDEEVKAREKARAEKEKARAQAKAGDGGAADGGAVSVPPSTRARDEERRREERRRRRKRVHAVAHFEVQEFKPAEFTAQARAQVKSILRGEPFSVKLSGRYLFGGAMAQAKVRWSLDRSHAHYVPKGHEGFSFADDATKGRYADKNGHVASDSDVLSQKGELTVDIDAAKSDPGHMRSAERLVFEATITDPSGESTAAHDSVLVHPGSFYVGLRSGDYFQSVKDPLRLETIVVTPDGKPVAGKKVEIEVFRRQWDSVLRETQRGVARYETEVHDVPVGRCQVTSGTTPQRCDVQVPKAGYHVVRASSTDEKGRQVASSVGLYVTGGGYVPWPATNEPRVEIVPDKKSYKPGEKARLLVKSPYPDVEALLTVERGGIFERRHVKLSGSGTPIEVAIRKEHAPNVFVSVVLVRGRVPVDKDPPKGAKPVGKPVFKMGYVMLPVSAEKNRLRVEIAPDEKKKRPGAEVTVNLRVETQKKAPARAEVTVFAVDEGVLLLSGYKTPDPLPVFFGDRQLGVTTADNRVHVADRSAESGEKGDDTGGDGASPQPRRRFVANAYYNARVITDADGRAQVKFKLPDNLTTFRLMAVAATAGEEFGSGESQVVVAQPLLLRAALPRFVRVGDRFEGGVVVHNETGEPGHVRVRVQADGLEVEKSPTQELALGAGDAAAVRFQLRAPKVGPVKLRFDARFKPFRKAGARPPKGAKDEYADAVALERRVLAPPLVETVALEGDIEGGIIERIAPLKGVRKDVGGLEITVGTSPLERILGAMESLFEYPYGCLEQTASRLVPLIAAKELVDSMGVAVKHRLKPDVRTVAQAGVDRIQRFANDDGGFGMWIGASKSSPVTTGIALWALTHAVSTGYHVDRKVIEGGIAYLRKELAKRKLDPKTDEGLEPYLLAERAFLLRVLAEVDAPEVSYTAALYEQRSKLPTFALADLLVALHVGKMDKGMIADVRKRIVERAVPQGRAGAMGYVDTQGGDYGGLFASDLRTTAAVVEALARVAPDEPLLPKLVRGLLQARRGGTWRNTQENGYAVRALWQALGAKVTVRTDLDAVVMLNGREVLKTVLAGDRFRSARAFVPMAELLKNGAREQELVIERRGWGRLYYTARLSYVRDPVPTVGRDSGLRVERRYEVVDLVNGQLEARPAKEVRAGQIVRVTLTVINTSDEEFVAIDDPLPAGLEPINFGLRNVSRTWQKLLGEEGEATSEGSRFGRYGSGWYSHKELRDDRVLVFADDLAAGVHRFTYLAKAITPGTFQAPPLKAECMYAPEVHGRTGASRFGVER